MRTAPSCISIKRPLSPFLLAGALLCGALAALLPMVALAPLVEIGLALIVLALFPIATAALPVLAVPLQDQLPLPGGYHHTQVMVALAAVTVGARYLTRAKWPRPGPLIWPWLGFLAALLLSTALTPYDINEAIRQVARWSVAFLVWLMASCALAERHNWAWPLVACLVAAPTAVAAYGIWQFLTGSGPPSFRISETLPFARAAGTIGQPNAFAGYLNQAWPLALAVAVGLSEGRRGTDQRSKTKDQPGQTADHRPQRALCAANPITDHQPRTTTTDHGPPTTDHRQWTMDDGPATAEPGDHAGMQQPSTMAVASTAYRIPSTIYAALAWLCVLILLGGLAASFSRGGWIGAAVGVLGLLLALGRGAGRAVGVLAVLGAVVGGLAWANLLPNALETRVVSITRNLSFFDPATVTVTPENFAVVERMSQMYAGVEMGLQRPLTGVGPGNFSTVYPLVTSAPWYVSRGHAHNYYIHSFAETGIIGAAAYACLMLAAGWRAWMLARGGANRMWRAVGIGCFGVIMAVVGHNMFENLHVLNFGIQLSGVWALAEAGLRHNEEQR